MFKTFCVFFTGLVAGVAGATYLLMPKLDKLKQYEQAESEVLKDVPRSPDPSDVNYLWDRTDCTCGVGDKSLEHFLKCAKWIAILPNHAKNL